MHARMGAAADIAEDAGTEGARAADAPADGARGEDADLLDAGTPTGRRGRAAPERRCIVTRAVQSPSAMVRFVRGPDGVVVPDLKAVLPGRGAWVTGSREHVAEAVHRRAFPRAFKGEATVPPGLAETVERLLLARAVEGLSLANKAGAVIAGKGQVEEAARKGHILAILHAAEASAGESAKLDALAVAVARSRGQEVTVVRDLASDALGLALGRLHVIHAALSGSTPGRDAQTLPRDPVSDVSRMALSRIARLAAYRGACEPDLPDDSAGTLQRSGAPPGA
ncbi:MAG: RNA-binding protein [Pseudomonadota bacterium]